MTDQRKRTLQARKGGATREAFGWVTTLPNSAAHAVAYAFSRTMAVFRLTIEHAHTSWLDVNDGARVVRSVSVPP